MRKRTSEYMTFSTSLDKATVAVVVAGGVSTEVPFISPSAPRSPPFGISEDMIN